MSKITLGIVGLNYGLSVQLPAFRSDSRCEVAAIAGRDAARTREAARNGDIARSYEDWRMLVADPAIAAVAIATPPEMQSAIAIAALRAGKAVFAEKPMAADLAGARAMVEAARASGRPAMIDFNFHEIAVWQRAKALLNNNALGAIRHIAVDWHIENRSIQMRQRNWKTLNGTGGGVLGNFVSHCFHYLEWFGGPLTRLSARVSGLPGDPDLQTTAVMALDFESGAVGSLSMSCASYGGGGHRIEIYGENGTLMLSNPGPDHMRGFELRFGARPAALTRIPVDDPLDAQYPGDGRIAPVARLAKRFFDAIENGSPATPGFAEGYRVQKLIDAAQRSDRQGIALDVRPAMLESGA